MAHISRLRYTCHDEQGRVSGMLADVPIFAVMVENLGERGAHLVAFKDFQEVIAEERPELKNAPAAGNSAPVLISAVVITILASLGALLLKRK